ncbi:MAG: carboxypeptidase regulatory-like domain-containing protein [Acidobacteria bacterium]|nr:carboxypeptidase regulatory-like domain-containing protein [Acidobacteriota bacterium]
MPKYIVLFCAVMFAVVSIGVSPVLAQGGGVRGKVRDTRGKAIPNAEVTARLDGNDIKTVKTNTKGEFRMEGLKPGTYNVAIDADGFSMGVKFGVKVTDKVIDLGGNLVLSVDEGNLVLIRGSVFTKQGRSVGGAKVELFEVRADGSERRVATGYTSTNGDFGFRRPKGAAKLKLVAKLGKASGEKMLNVDGPQVYRTAITLDESADDS